MLGYIMPHYLEKLLRYWHAIPALGRFFVGIFLIVLLIFGRLPVLLAVPLLLLAVFITSYSGYQFLIVSSQDQSIQDKQGGLFDRFTRPRSQSQEEAFDDWEEE
jgi:hypothetical protein